MPAFLTTASVLMCPHGGTVQAVSTSRVTAGGATVLRVSDTFIIAGCAFNFAGAPSPCVTVQWSGSAQRNQAGAPILTLASIGMCQAATQAVQGPVMIASTQTQVQGL